MDLTHVAADPSMLTAQKNHSVHLLNVFRTFQVVDEKSVSSHLVLTFSYLSHFKDQRQNW